MKDDAKASPSRSVLVTGATGRQGGAVAREPLARGSRLPLATRRNTGPTIWVCRAVGLGEAESMVKSGQVCSILLRNSSIDPAR